MVDEQDILAFGIKHSFPVFLFDSECKKVLHSSSGFLFFDPVLKSHLLLSVAHLFSDPSGSRKTGVFCGIKNGIPQYCRSPLISVQHFNEFAQTRSDYERIDVSFRLLKKNESIFNIKYDPEGNDDIEMVGCDSFSVIGETNIVEPYYFYGSVKPQMHIDANLEPLRIHAFRQCFEKIGYIKDEGFYHLFELENYRSFTSDAYKGCSGAPIFNNRGELVSMLTGHEGNCIIRGLNLCKVIPIIEQFFSLNLDNAEYKGLLK